MSHEMVEINSKLEFGFEPSMKDLSRIMKIMTENGSQNKTCLARDTNLNYGRLAKHIVWLAKRSCQINN